MFEYKSSVSRIALAAVLLSGSLSVADADSRTIVSGEHVVVDGVTVETPEIIGGEKLTVEQGGSIEGVEENAAYINGIGAVIDNSGKIFTAGPGEDAEPAILVDASGNDVDIKIINGAGAEISSVGQAALIGRSTGSGTITLNNSGLIISTLDEYNTSGKAIDFHDFKGTSAEALLYVTINNYEGGRIESQGHDAVRLGKENVVAVVNNWGTIISSGGGGDGIDLQDVKIGAGSRTINNFKTGVIEGDQHGIHGKPKVVTDSEGNKIPIVSIENDGWIVGRTGSGINIDTPTDPVSVINRGTITGGKVAGGDGDGIDIDNSLLLKNYGRVEGLNGSSAEGLAIGGGTINNYARAEIYGQGRGILADDSNEGAAPFSTTVDNEGLIEAGTFEAIKFIGTQADTIINKGTIRAGNSGIAIDMGGGDDTLTLHTGSVIEGIADGGAGGDQIFLYEAAGSQTGTLKDTREFEKVFMYGGTWTLEGYQRYDSFSVYGGSLVTTALTEGAVYAYAGRIEGTGSSTTLGASEATLSPGTDAAPIGTLTAKQHLSVDYGATYEVDVDAEGNGDRLVSEGAASIGDNTSVVVTASSGNYAPATTYTILSAANGVTGEFDSVTDNFAFLDSALSQDANNVFLTLTRNDMAFWDVADTKNQSAVAHAIAATGGSALHNEIVTKSVGEAQGAFNSLSGESYASSMSGQIMQATLVNDTIQGHAGSVFGSVGGSAQPPAFAQPQYLGARRPKREARPQGDGVPASYSAGWMKGFGQWLSMDSDGNAAALDSAVGGVVGGYDVVSRGSMFGFAAGYSQASADVNSRASSIDTDSFHVATYGAIRVDNNLKLSAGATYAWSSSDSKRVALGDKLTASYDGNTSSVFGEVAYLTRVGWAAFEPFAGISYIDVDEDGFTEAGGIGALTSDGRSFDSVSSTVGLRVAYESIGADGTRITPRASLAWRHAFGDLTPDAALRFADTGAAFTVSGTPIGQNSVVVGAGLDFGLSDNVTIGFDYTGAFADGATSNAVRAVGRIGF